jgi:hypothetical protein
VVEVVEGLAVVSAAAVVLRSVAAVAAVHEAAATVRLAALDKGVRTTGRLTDP